MPTTQIAWDRPNIVGTIHCAAGWKAAARADLDAVEVRLDCLGRPPGPRDFQSLKAPVILTARDPREGGAGKLRAAERRALLMPFLGQAGAVDIEARNLSVLRGVVEAAGELGVPVIASIHDFGGFPTGLPARARKAREMGAAVVKIAVQVRHAADMRRLAGLFREIPPPLAVMGMGPLGMASRVVAAACGSCLNYGWLAAPQVPGQWPAHLMRRLFRGLGM